MLKRKAFFGIAVAGIAMAALVPAPAYAADITVSVKTANGSGCPSPDSVIATPTADNTAFTLTYNQFEARGGEVKNCQLGVRVAVPSGLTFAIYKVDNRGYAVLEAGETGKHTITAYFAGGSTTLKAKKELSGPYDDTWQTTTSWPGLDWAPCDGAERLLNVNDILRVTGSNANLMSLFSTDLGVSTIFHIQTMPCP